MQERASTKTNICSLLVRKIESDFIERDISLDKDRAALISQLAAAQKIHSGSAFVRTKDLYRAEFIERRKIIVKEIDNLFGTQATHKLNEVKEVCVSILQVQMKNFIEKMKSNIPFKMGGQSSSSAAAQKVIEEFLGEFDAHKNALETDIDIWGHKMSTSPKTQNGGVTIGQVNGGNIAVTTGNDSAAQVGNQNSNKQSASLASMFVKIFSWIKSIFSGGTQ